MQQIDPGNAEEHKDRTENGGRTVSRHALGRHLRRYWMAWVVLLAVVGLVLLPPLINVNRLQRRITTSIGGSLGRPVHLDRISLSLLPLPGFEIQNLVVDEDPAFGSEPIIRANTVRATLRLSSLWRRRVEFSTIRFLEPSLNLVHMADGKWNIEGVLLQASRIDTAPTAQKRSGPAPRFPYIEATSARINFKQGVEKMPFSLIDSEFALWSSDPNQWRLRLRAHPARTDTNVSDTGAVEMEGTLGRGDSLAHIPINLEGQWRDAPLGEASRVLLGSDAGWRGNMVLTANIRGTLGESAVTTRLRLLGARRADFVPQQPLSADVQCFATAMTVFYSYEDLRCAWSPAGTANSPIVALTGGIPDIRQIETASLQIGTSGIPAATVLDWLRVLSPGINDEIAATGELSGSVVYDGAGSRRWTGQAVLHDATLKTAAMRTDDTTGSSSASDSILSGDLQFRLAPEAGENAHSPSELVLGPVAVALGGREPATLDGRFDGNGYRLRLAGMAAPERLKQFAVAVAPFGAGLAGTTARTDDGKTNLSEPTGEPEARAKAPERIDLTSAGAWSDPHLWQETASRQAAATMPRRPR